ncbi:hypothetical protein L1987_74864 [Smallanthus sonchifolius]|uniref:Uncharacterized protein n=1 Tax=Smallanthus sonchifolius TaxID=185202 RepID=A0ACB9A442_9ASTR|nr:hypothetical protein L1987_74864 [Smallanthus sonchifolius]
MKRDNKFILKTNQISNQNSYIHLLTNHYATNFQILQWSTRESSKNPPIIGPNSSGVKRSKRFSSVEFASLGITNVNKLLSVNQSLVCKDRCDGDITVRNTSKKHI